MSGFVFGSPPCPPLVEDDEEVLPPLDVPAPAPPLLLDADEPPVSEDPPQEAARDAVNNAVNETNMTRAGAERRTSGQGRIIEGLRGCNKAPTIVGKRRGRKRRDHARRVLYPGHARRETPGAKRCIHRKGDRFARGAQGSVGHR